MKNEKYMVKEVIKQGMLFGYVIVNTLTNDTLPYDFNEDEKYKADSKCELLNTLNK
jgi:hypothetical protein